MKKLALLLGLVAVFASCQKEDITPAQKKILLLKSAAIQEGDDQDSDGPSEGGIPPGNMYYCKLCAKNVPAGHGRVMGMGH